MREIKFRAWDTKDKRFVFSPDMSHNFCRNHINFWAWCEDNEVELGDIILMQYTGLKDKNGKEIYEGDILKYTAFWGLGVVEMSKYVTGNEDNEDILGWAIRGRERYYALDPQCTYEVIGNIYQNPELLK